MEISIRLAIMDNVPALKELIHPKEQELFR